MLIAFTLACTFCFAGISRRAESSESSRLRRDLRRHYDSLQLLWDCVHTISAVCSSLQRRLDGCGGVPLAAQMDLLLMDEIGFLLGTHAPVSNSPSTPSYTNVLQSITNAASDVLLAVGGAPRLALHGKDLRGGYDHRDFEGLAGGNIGNLILHCAFCVRLQRIVLSEM